MWHEWKYIAYRKWECRQCGGKTDNPNKGEAQKPTCPGKKKK